MRVVVNGAERELPRGASVADAVAGCGLGPEARGVAAALDGRVVPRAEWAATPLPDGGRLEVVRAAAGG